MAVNLDFLVDLPSVEEVVTQDSLVDLPSVEEVVANLDSLEDLPSVEEVVANLDSLEDLEVVLQELDPALVEPQEWALVAAVYQEVDLPTWV